MMDDFPAFNICKGELQALVKRGDPVSEVKAIVEEFVMPGKRNRTTYDLANWARAEINRSAEGPWLEMYEEVLKAIDAIKAAR
jgi:hypothetical protein